MHISVLDWIIIALYFLISIGIGIYMSKRAGRSTSDFFLSGRKLPWYIAGTSMVATTFAADTPLAITEMVADNGIAGNWLWWNMLFGGMLTVFFFARLWRRADIMTDCEFVSIRYEGVYECDCNCLGESGNGENYKCSISRIIIFRSGINKYYRN